MARKREERSGGKNKENGCANTKAAAPSAPPPPEAPKAEVPPMVELPTMPTLVFEDLENQLKTFGLMLREIPGDGNCLFGALADQVDGTRQTHNNHRSDVVSYMRKHKLHFEPFVEDDMDFGDHLRRLSEVGTFGGNECIVAFARLRAVMVVIHQVNTPVWRINGFEESPDSANFSYDEVHISYHNGDHYNSVRRLNDFTDLPANIKLGVDHKPHHSRLVEKLREYTGCSDQYRLWEYLRNFGFRLDDAAEALVDAMTEEMIQSERRMGRPVKKGAERRKEGGASLAEGVARIGF